MRISSLEAWRSLGWFMVDGEGKEGGEGDFEKGVMRMMECLMSNV